MTPWRSPNKMKKLIGILILVTLAGCENTQHNSARSSSSNLPPEIASMIQNQIMGGMQQNVTLLLAAQIHREAYGAWPDSIEDLKNKTEGDIDFSKFEEVEFSVVSSELMKIKITNGSTTITLDATHDPDTDHPLRDAAKDDPNFKIRIMNDG